MNAWIEAVDDVPLWRLVIAIPLALVVGIGLALFACRGECNR